MSSQYQSQTGPDPVAELFSRAIARTENAVSTTKKRTREEKKTGGVALLDASSTECATYVDF
jgi:hypothetical protein